MNPTILKSTVLKSTTLKSALSALTLALAVTGLAACRDGQSTSSALADAPKAPVIFVIAQAKVTPGNEAAFKQAAQQILVPTRQEAGNVTYTFYQASSDPTQFATYEIWDSQEALDAHLKSPHMTQFFNQVGSFFAPGYPVITNYTQLAPQ